MTEKKRALNAIICVVLAAVIAAGIEMLLSNYRYFGYSKNSSEPYVLEKSVSTGTENYFYDENNSVALYAGRRVDCLSFCIESPDAGDDKLYDIDISLSFPEDKENFNTVVSDKIGIGSARRTYRYYLNQTISAYAVKITIHKAEGTICISEATVNPQYKLQFNAVRAAVIFTLIAAIAFTAAYGIYKKEFDAESKKHRAYAVFISLLCCALVLLACIFVLNTSTEETAYPLKKSVESYNPYIQQFDAFMKGQLNLDADPPEALSKLANPYDKKQREGIHYLWDRAYYNGKYYSYFGTGPIIAVYAPYYLIKGALPSYRFVTTVLCTVTALFMSLALFRWAAVFRKKISIPILTLADISMIFSSLLFLEMRGLEPFYYIALLCASAFLSIFAYTLLCAFSAKKHPLRLILFAVSGAAFGMAFLSRVNTVITAGLIAAAAVVIYFVKSIKEKRKMKLTVPELTCLGLPVILAVCTAGIFNYLRFGNPLDFGTDYQLTVSDTSLNGFFAAGLPASIFYYFFEKAEKVKSFPFFAVGRGGEYPIENRYVYKDDNIGIFSVPHNICLLLLPAFPLGKKKSIYEHAVVTAGITGIILTAYTDFCLGGVIFRYTGDISFAGAFIAAVIIIGILSSLRTSERNLKVPVFAAEFIFALIFISSVILAALYALTVDANLSAFDVDAYEAIKRFFCVWL